MTLKIFMKRIKLFCNLPTPLEALSHFSDENKTVGSLPPGSVLEISINVSPLSNSKLNGIIYRKSDNLMMQQFMLWRA